MFTLEYFPNLFCLKFSRYFFLQKMLVFYSVVIILKVSHGSNILMTNDMSNILAMLDFM